ncbi:UNVERIFIED_CONTAM: protein NRT1/ PTR FAMILY 6.2 [Sesamum radiatum]|uniref:Protein NRT1/ PTR FAMILY 6.2 n=1 Tax=Sesamum radiatum TaxID=300843 RepID=A0AAW2KXJ5_SESRA
MHRRVVYLSNNGKGVMIRLVPSHFGLHVRNDYLFSRASFHHESNRYIGGFRVPAGSFTLFFVAAVLISLAGFTNLQRTGIGLALSTPGKAATTLAKKHDLANEKGNSPRHSNAATSVFLLIPQFLLVYVRLDLIIKVTKRDENYKHFSPSSLLVSIVEKVTTTAGTVKG